MEQGTKLHTKGRFNIGRNAEVDGNLFKFRGEGGRVGVVRIVEPLTPMLNYFEYEIVCKGSKCAIGVGVGDLSYPLERMPGWNRNGIGYHADDGRLFHENGYGKGFGPTCTEGDRMGCGVDYNADVGDGYVDVFFTKNGKRVGDSMRMKRPVYGLYPLIGLHSQNEVVRYLGHWQKNPDSLLEPMVQDHSPSSTWLRSNGVKFVDDGCTIEYTGDGLSNQDVGIAQANFRIDKQNHYFEMDVLSSGKKGWLALGLAIPTYPLHRHPGWNKGSIGYHADNGHMYKERGHGEPFGPTCTDGDTMGCGVIFSNSDSDDVYPDRPLSPDSDSDIEDPDMVRLDQAYDDMLDYNSDEEDYCSDDDEFLFGGHGRIPAIRGRANLLAQAKSVNESKLKGTKCTVYFTKNGEVIGETDFYLPPEGLYPVVAMMTPGEKVKVNLKPITG
ncbi:SPRY domain-containing protein 3-like [Halichondria panicea]|uniref:SPRY domain-containing protein 3-like n=1 Tax=Halichondria panicea TaxID=6063 RepID=UPI00312BC29E